MSNGIERKARWLFVIVLLGALGGGAWYVLVPGRYTTYQLTTHDVVSGLIHDSPVEFHGVQVGRVKLVKLVEPDLVRILLSVEKGTPISTATVATITSRGLSPRGFMGYVYVSLEDVGNHANRLRPQTGNQYPEIPTAPRKSMSVDIVASQLNELVHSLLDDKTVAALKDSAASLQEIARVLAEEKRELATLIVNAEGASDRLEPLLDSTDQALSALQTQLLPEAYKALSKLDTLSSTLNDIAARAERNPSILLRGVAPPGPGPGEK